MRYNKKFQEPVSNFASQCFNQMKLLLANFEKLRRLGNLASASVSPEKISRYFTKSMQNFPGAHSVTLSQCHKCHRRKSKIWVKKAVSQTVEQFFSDVCFCHNRHPCCKCSVTNVTRLTLWENVYCLTFGLSQTSQQTYPLKSCKSSITASQQTYPLCSPSFTVSQMSQPNSGSFQPQM